MIWKFVIRSLLKRPVLNLIKVGGLLISISSLLLISHFIRYELSFDKFHANADRIYRFTVTSPDIFAGKHFARIYNSEYIPELARTFPGVENHVRLAPLAGGLIQWQDQKIELSQAFKCDSTFFDVFDVKLLSGDPGSVLKAPGSLIISQSYARRIFGDVDPVGQILTQPPGRYVGEPVEYTVNGVMEDFPDNSHFHPELITTPTDWSELNGWSWVYLLLKHNAAPTAITSSFREFYSNYYEQDPEESTLSAHLQGIQDIHLHSNKTREIEANSNILVVYSFVLAGLILLFVALINYFNLNLGMEGFSEKYRFISKVHGNSQRGLLRQFLVEGLIILMLAIALSALVVYFSNSYIQQRFGIRLLDGHIGFTLGIALLVALVSYLAGLAPHLRMMSNGLGFQRSEKAAINYMRGAVSKVLIVVQYTIGIILIISVIVIQRQTSLALRSGIGAENNNIICIEYVHSDITQQFPEFKKELLKYTSVEQVSGMFEKPGGDVNDLMRFFMSGYEVDETRPNDDYIGIFPCDYSFPSLFDLNFLAGNSFSEDFSDNEGSGEYIINETAMRRLRFSDPREIINKEFQVFFHTPDITMPAGRIIGVVEDFHVSSLKRDIEALVLFKRKDIWIDNLLITCAAGQQERALADLKAVWKQMFPAHEFRFEYIDSMYKQVYLSERLQSSLLFLFTIFGLFISSMGLLGLSLLSTQQRKKEIAIRVVNGAGVWQIVSLLNWDFLKLVALSYLLAIPLSYFALKRWLEEFAYRTELSWWLFVLAGAIAFLIAGLTITSISWKAARRNPSEVLGV